MKNTHFAVNNYYSPFSLCRGEEERQMTHLTKIFLSCFCFVVGTHLSLSSTKQIAVKKK